MLILVNHRVHKMIENLIPALLFPGSISEGLVVKEKENFAGHELVLGPHYQPKDLRVSWAQHLHKDVSGTDSPNTLTAGPTNVFSVGIINLAYQSSFFVFLMICFGTLFGI